MAAFFINIYINPFLLSFRLFGCPQFFSGRLFISFIIFSFFFFGIYLLFCFNFCVHFASFCFCLQAFCRLIDCSWSRVSVSGCPTVCIPSVKRLVEGYAGPIKLSKWIFVHLIFQRESKCILYI